MDVGPHPHIGRTLSYDDPTSYFLGKKTNGKHTELKSPKRMYPCLGTNRINKVYYVYISMHLYVIHVCAHYMCMYACVNVMLFLHVYTQTHMYTNDKCRN